MRATKTSAVCKVSRKTRESKVGQVCIYIYICMPWGRVGDFCALYIYASLAERIKEIKDLDGINTSTTSLFSWIYFVHSWC